MVEQLPVDCEHVVRLTVVPSDPVAIHLCRAVGTTWIKRCVLVLRRRARPKHLACTCLIETNTGVHTSDRFQQIQRRNPRCPRRVQGFVERNADMRLRGEVVDLVRSKVGYELMHARGIGHVTVVKMQILSRQMFIVVQVIDATAVERAGPPDKSVNFIALVH